jgi:hypothetical protein
MQPVASPDYSIEDRQWRRHIFLRRPRPRAARRWPPADVRLQPFETSRRIAAQGRKRESSSVSSRHSTCPGARLASAAIAQSLKRWLRASPAPGYDGCTLIPAAGVAISSAPQRPECSRDREFSVWPPPTGNAANRLFRVNQECQLRAISDCRKSGTGPLDQADPRYLGKTERELTGNSPYVRVRRKRST